MLWRWRIFNCPWMALSVNFPLNSHSPWTSWCYVWRLLQLWFFVDARHTLIDSLGGKLFSDWVKWRFCTNRIILPRTSTSSLSGFLGFVGIIRIADLDDVVVCTFRFLCFAGIVLLLRYIRSNRWNTISVVYVKGTKWMKYIVSCVALTVIGLLYDSILSRLQSKHTRLEHIFQLKRCISS